MLKRKMATIFAIFIFVFITQITFGDISFGISFDNRHDYRFKPNERITSEKLDGYEVDDWTERGSASVTESPKYDDGIRLASWADRYDDEYDYGLASAVYLFKAPYRANDAKITVRYDGSHGKYSDDDNIAGRLWIKATDNTTRYYPKEGKYDNEALYGDTFILRENKKKEEIIFSLREHVINGVMEIHIIAEGGQLIDVDDIKVESYTSLPEVRIIAGDYNISKPWYNNTYLYFYTGPIYYFGRGHYVCYDYSNNRYSIEVRKQYGRYLSEFQVRHPHIRLYWSGRADQRKGSERVWLDKWTPAHEATRKSYAIDSRKSRKPIEVRVIREQVQRVINERRSPSSINVEKDERKENKEDNKIWKKEWRNNNDEDDDRQDRRGRLRDR